MKEIKRLNKNKPSEKSNIPITIIYKNADIFADFLAESLKSTIKTYNFPKCLRLADITPLHKTRRKDNRENLLTLSKILERILFEQMSVYFDKFLSDQQCGFRKGYSTQHCPFNDITSVVLISNMTLLILLFTIKMEELC